MRIGELAQKTGVTADTLRFYEREGLVRADRWPNGYRDFPEATVGLVRMIRQAQGLGFTLSEIGALLRGMIGPVGKAAGKGLSEDEIAVLLQGKLDEIDQKIAEMTELRATIALRLAQACPLGL